MPVAGVADPGKGPERGASVWQVVKAVFWSFLGIRKRTDHESDAVRIKPVQVIIAGLIGAALFVATLLVVVRFVIGRAAG